MRNKGFAIGPYTIAIGSYNVDAFSHFPKNTTWVVFLIFQKTTPIGLPHESMIFFYSVKWKQTIIVMFEVKKKYYKTEV